MGLRSEVQEALTEAFDGDLLDVVTNFTLEHTTALGTYDLADDEYTPTTVPHETRGIFVSYGVDEIDEVNIRSEDEKVFVNEVDLPNVIPMPDDMIYLENSVEYRVIKATRVPGGSAPVIGHILQVRKNVQHG